jgi:hypothetical protein
MKAMFEQGQKELEQLQREDPAKLAELKSKFGSLLGDEGDDKG